MDASPESSAEDPSASSTRSGVRDAYDRYHQALDATPFAKYTRFMNFGVALLPDVERGALPPRLPNIESAQLLLELIGKVPVANRTVLDVGCGRGGGLWLLERIGPPRLAIGVDLSTEATRASRASVGSGRRTQVATADAEALPLRDASVDVVLNLESSLHYPRVERFYREVARVMRVGGSFCYGDLFDVALIGVVEAALSDAGFDLIDNIDITGRVLESRNHRATRQASPLPVSPELEPTALVAAPGSPFYQAMERGELDYRLMRLERNAASPREPDHGGRLHDTRASRYAIDIGFRHE